MIDGLARVGVLGMTAPKEYGGRGFSQRAYCKILEEIGARCASTSVFTNAHHSIGIRALLLFGTREQKQKWLPPLVTGEQLAAFALTEKEAGSDAANVQTRAEPSADGTHYILNGEKRYITNAAIAQVLTVMARTPVPGSDKTAITAFLVTPDMPGFEMLEPRMEKVGIRGTATGRFAMRDMAVPKENILGPLGKGLKVALTVLDFGRTTFGACCTGAAKTCLRLAVEHANTRRQFKKTLGDFDLVKKKIGRMAADLYAMEAMTAGDGFADRSRARGLHDGDGDAEGLHDGSPLGSGQRRLPDSRRLGLFQRFAARTNAARRADQPDRRREQRSAHVLHCARRNARAGHGVQRDPRHHVQSVPRPGESLDAPE